MLPLLWEEHGQGGAGLQGPNMVMVNRDTFAAAFVCLFNIRGVQKVSDPRSGGGGRGNSLPFGFQL